jgi:putative transposase
MPRLFESLWLVLATAGDRKLAQTVEYLKAENAILRSKLPKRITLTECEKNRLVKFGSKLGPAIRSVISIVSPRTFLRWVNGEVRTGESKGATKAKPGRPRTDDEVRELILRLAKENGWGYTRILGELKKLAVGSVSRSTVVNILKANGFDSGPTRGKGTWSEFIERHARTLWASDFLQVQTMTTKGLVDLFVLFFIQPHTKRAIISGITANPDSAWVTQQTRNVTMTIADLGFPTPEVLVIDHDSKYSKEFDAVWTADGTIVNRSRASTASKRTIDSTVNCEIGLESAVRSRGSTYCTGRAVRSRDSTFCTGRIWLCTGRRKPSSVNIILKC